MATSRLCTACLRPLALRQSAGQKASASQVLDAAQHHRPNSPSAVTPLYLDFLAPAWRASSMKPTSKAASRQYHTPARSVQRWNQQASSMRTFSTSHPRPATAILNPRQDDDGNAMTITITPRAAHRLRAIAAKDGNPDLALRVSVESGGCHGFQYLMSLVNARTDVDGEEDTVFREEGGGSTTAQDGRGEYRAQVVMDLPSLDLLKGSSVDYTMELIGSQFKVVGIPGAKSSCGCGTSFDIAA